MTRTLLTLLTLAATAAAGRAQYQNPGQYQQPSMPGTAGVPMPSNYRPPLSPYLNLLRGGDPAINYYYAVRPALMNGVSPLGSMAGGTRGFSQLRNGFLPAAGNPTQEPVVIPLGGVEVPSFQTSGYPVSYGGLTRFSPGSGSRQSQFGGSATSRPATSPAGPRR